VTETDRSTAALRDAVVEVERFVAEAGWDQPGRLFALVTTRDLVAAEPELAAALATHAHQPADDALTPVEQEVDLGPRSLEELLATIAWPPAVVGALVTVERVVLPPTAEDDVPEDATAAERFASGHPEREDVRLVAGVLRSGEGHCLIRLRSRPAGEDLIHGPDLVPGLVLALRETLEADAADDVRPRALAPGRASAGGKRQGMTSR
jgi:hypothetical protein